LSGVFVLVICCGNTKCVDALYRQRILPIDPAIVLTQQGGEVLVLKTKGGEIDIFVVVRLLGRNSRFRHYVVVLINDE
jgi:hypothetical protein